MDSPPSDNLDTKTAFRKPSNDVANRKYRRHSPVSGSSSSDESPKHNRSSSTILSKEDVDRVSEPRESRKDDKRELDRDSGRSHYGRSGDLCRQDRHSSRDTRHYSKREEYSRRDRDADGEDRKYQMSPRDSVRESRGSRQSRDHLERYSRDKYAGSGHRSRDKEKDPSSVENQKHKVDDPSSDRAGSRRRHTDSIYEETKRDRHARDREYLDEKVDSRRSSGDRRSDRTHSHDERRFEDYETKKEKDIYFKAPKNRFEDKNDVGNEDREHSAKKSKPLSSEKFIDNKVEQNQPSSLKQATETGCKVLQGQTNSNEPGTSNDLDAAKVAAMKAAELVNRNLVGTGFLTTDQKKKLLWGNKKSTAAEESANRWDSALIGDRERQEKFNKLMGVKGNMKPEQKTNDQDLLAEKQKELQLDLEKQYTAGLRRRDGRTVGLGL